MIGTPADELRQDGEELLNFLVPVAFTRLEADGEFVPFGAIVLAEGGVEPVEAAPGTAATKEPDEVFAEILESIRDDAESGKFRSAGLCADVHLVNEEDDTRTDAVRVYMERRDGEAMDVFLPYEAGPDGGFVRGQIFAVEAQPKLFVTPEPGGPEAAEGQ
ncbi:MAG: hypothetical protein ABFS86_12485 [Planctomycetota bacterium]